MKVPALPSFVRKEVRDVNDPDFFASVVAGVVANLIYQIICKWFNGDE